MKAIQINRYGGPEVLEWRDIPEPVAGPGQALVEHTAIGLNFIDTYQRSGLYPLTLPAGLGMEAAGVVRAIGPGVNTVVPGDRVAYCTPPPGAYAQKRTIAADRLVRLPAGSMTGPRQRRCSRGSPPGTCCGGVTGCSPAMRCWSTRRPAASG